MCDAVFQNHDMMCQLFAYYAAGIEGGDIHSMGLNEWNMFLEDFRLSDRKSNFCKRSDLDRLFIAVDVCSARRSQEAQKLSKVKHAHGSADKQKAFDRVEFIVALIHIATMK